MKIRIGVGMGAGAASDSATFTAAVQSLERLGFDSLWLSEVLTGAVVDPLAGLAFAAGMTRKLKLGTTMTLTGRNPVRVAKELATIDRFSSGRLLLVFVPGLTDQFEDQALGVPVAERGAWIEEVLPLVRRLWSEDDVTHTGQLFRYQGLSVRPKPLQRPLEVWLGGTARSALRRAGRLSDGWLPSLCAPEEAAAGRATIEAAAAEVGRRVDPEHFGISLSYARTEISPAQAARVLKRRPGLDPATLIPLGLPAARDLLALHRGRLFEVRGATGRHPRGVAGRAGTARQRRALAPDLTPQQGRRGLDSRELLERVAAGMPAVATAERGMNDLADVQIAARIQTDPVR